MNEKSKKQGSKKESQAWKSLTEEVEEEGSYQYPKVTVVIPTHNCAQPISFTLESVTQQNYPNLEIIVIDASSKDRTMEVVKQFIKKVDRIYSVSEYNLYEMMNRGISLATGEYINFFFPGDSYVSMTALRHLMKLAIDSDKPDLVYCGTLLRDDTQEPRILLRSLSNDYLKKGKQPTSIEACCFKVESIRLLNKFSTNYQIRGGFDLFCRFHHKKELTVVMSQFVLADYERRGGGYAYLIRHSIETFKIILKHFGVGTAIKWWILQNPFHFIRWWLSSMKLVFLGR